MLSCITRAVLQHSGKGVCKGVCKETGVQGNSPIARKVHQVPAVIDHEVVDGLGHACDFQLAWVNYRVWL